MRNKYLFLTLIAIAFLSCQSDPEIPIFTDENIHEDISVDYTTAHIDAMFDVQGTADQYQYALLYAENEDFSSVKQVSLSKDSYNHQCCDLSNLQIGKTYYYRYKVSNAVNSYCSGVYNFCTKTEGVPLVETQQVNGVMAVSAIANAKVIYDGNAKVTYKGICYSTHSNPNFYYDSCVVSPTAGEGAYSCLLQDLQPNTTYYVRAYAVNKYGVGYGEQVQFKTTLK